MKTKTIWVIGLTIVSLTWFSCRPEIETTVPHLAIIGCTNITDTSVIVRGKIISDGGSPVTEIKAIVQPGNLVFTSSQTISQGEFVIEINNLEPSTEYQVSVYATNIAGSSLSEVASITTADKPSDPNDPADPNANAFRIPGVYMADVVVDSLGGVYVSGGFFISDATRTDCFIAKFSPTGELIWRNNISTKGGDSNSGNMVIDQEREVIYLFSLRNDPYDTGGGNLYLSSYNLSDGSLNWENRQKGVAVKSLLNKDGDLISACGSAGIVKTNPQGEVVSAYTGPYNYGMALSGDDLIAITRLEESEQTIVDISKFQGFFQEKIWEFRSFRNKDMTPLGVVNLPKDSLIIIVWMTEASELGWPDQAHVTAYKNYGNGELYLAWEHKYIAANARVVLAYDKLLISPVNGESYTELVDLQGNSLWRDNNEVYRIAYFKQRVYMVNRNDQVRIANL